MVSLYVNIDKLSLKSLFFPIYSHLFRQAFIKEKNKTVNLSPKYSL